METSKFKKTYLLINIPIMLIFFILLITPLFIINKVADVYYVGIVARIIMGIWFIFNSIWNACTDYYSIFKNNKFQKNNKTPKWLNNRKEDLLPVGYFHAAFTMPEELNFITLINQKEMYSIFFQSVSETLLELSRDIKYLDAEIGFTTILHTWGQNLINHPHLHCIVPGGESVYIFNRIKPN